MRRFGTREGEKEILKKIIYLRQEQNLSFRGIADALNSEMLPTKLGKPWCKELVINVYGKNVAGQG